MHNYVAKTTKKFSQSIYFHTATYFLLGSCITNTLDPINNGSTLYVTGRTTLCFSCNACSSPSISWNLISYEGHIWTGDSGENLSSEDSPKDRGEVYSNGTLLVTNSSSVFSTSHPGIIRFSEQGSQDTWKYNVYLGGNNILIVVLRLN